ncbi:multidrug efflux MFS transporter [Acetonema longum]|uniref:Major facilitator superfamily MFS_1 n=1 Tax=Acetonema longum DSM 6540 TaxID=1009370 RepID=F7NEP8_9FIRM|nr:multidrug efflux MFS transporter [Acetonema longum]EGO65459.1 major facilitator superfamily MFS_1 [Acetonema longum DSM 6540]
MESWEKNLGVCWLATLIVSLGMSQMAPILPLYVEHLGVHGQADIARWSGIVFGLNFVSLAIFSPIWGRLSDQYGRRPMILRASFSLAVIMTCMGFAQNVWQLAGLRLMQGTLSGFQSTVVTLVGTQTPTERAGWALGVLFSAQVGGTLMGPLLGGVLSEFVGFRGNFFVIGILCFLAFIASYRFIYEKKIDTTQPALDFHEVWSRLPHPRDTVCLLITTLLLQLALMAIQPIITVYISHLSADAAHIALVSGAVFAASGLASLLAAPKLGKISDRIGPHKVLLAALTAAGIIYIPQAFVSHAWELGILRFMLGMAVAGLLPSVNSLIKHSTPPAITGRAFGFNQSAQYVGMFLGSMLGGQMAAAFGIQNVFLFTGGLLLANAFWVYHTIYQHDELFRGTDEEK